ncbi:hypothetical protein B0H34DRAFT_726051, partial [Crassisporium funariophilum]
MCSALGEAFRVYLGSKSTSMGSGGYQGRVLLEEIFLRACAPVNEDTIPFTLSQALIPLYPSHCVVYVLPGPHGDNEYI